MDISCGSICIAAIICMYLFNRAFVIWLVTRPDVVWTNSNSVPTWSAGASSGWDNSSDKLMVISGSTTFQPPTSHSNPLSPSRSHLVPLWLMWLTLHMLPLRQEQLTASLTVPQVPKMTQPNRIRVCIWGGGCFCACMWGHRRNIHEVVCFFSQFMSGKKKGAAARVGWCLGSRVVVRNKTGGGEIGIWGGDSLQSATMVYLPKAEISA